MGAFVERHTSLWRPRAVLYNQNRQPQRARKKDDYSDYDIQA